MSTSLSVLFSGVVGVNPRILFMETDLGQDIVFGPGFVNSIEETTEVKIQKGDFIFILFDSNLLQEMAVPQFADDGVITLLPVAGDLNTGGPIDGGQNLGFGQGVFAQVAGSLMQFKSLVAGTNVSLSSDSTSITINATNSGGTVTGGQNVGSGDGVFLGLSGPTMQFKSLTEGANIVLTPNGTEIQITATGSGGGSISDGTNLGAGNEVFADVNGANLEFRTFIAGTGINMVQAADTITVSSTTSGGTITDGQNIGGQTGVFAQAAGSILQFKTIAAGSNIGITSDDNVVTISSAGGGGGGNFPYENTYWVAQNGSDTNLGNSINEPFQTFGPIQEILATNAVICVNVVDNGTYVLNTLALYNETYINAPDATFTHGTGTVMFYLNTTGLSNLTIKAKAINGAGSTVIFSGSGSLTADIDIIENANLILNQLNIISGTVVNMNIGTTDADGGTFNLASNGTTSITSTNLGQSLFDCDNTSQPVTIRSDYFDGALVGTSDYVLYTSDLGPDFSETTTGDVIIIGIVQGQPLKVINWNSARTITLTGTNYAEYQNAFIWYNGTNGYGRFEILGATDPTVPIGFTVSMFQTNNGNQAGIFGSSINLVSSSTVPGVAYTRTEGSWITIVKTSVAGTDTYVAYGDLWQSNLTASTNLYVSQLTGADNVENGSSGNPYATIQYAVTQAGSPSNPLNIIVLDDQTYAENITIANQNINLLAAGAIIAPASGDAITFPNALGQVLLNVGQINVASGANAINSTYNSSGAGGMIVNCNFIQGNVRTVNSTIIIEASSIQGNRTSTGSGLILYRTVLISGTNSSNVSGTSISGSTSGTFTLNTLIANGLTYPSSDSTAGFVVTTNGSGVLSLQPSNAIVTPVIPWIGWNYFVWAAGNAAWSQTDSLNGSPYGGSYDLGTQNLIIPVTGTYRFSVAFFSNTNQGILQITINSVVTNVDCYGVNGAEGSLSWTQALTAGTYTIAANNLTKNVLSSDYQLLLTSDGLLITLD